MEDDIKILDTKYWEVFLTRNHAYLGYCVVGLKSKAPTMSQISPEEWIEFHELILKKLEFALKKSFGTTLFNWGCLMNYAYRRNPPNPKVHWHFVPRYENKVEFAGEIFEDTEFSNHYDCKRKKIVSREVQELIAKEIKKNLDGKK